ncbi:hypothetical protein DFH07DRAFT_970077 [Mycena maculata]|uniref:Uncharacterized protein n=1 Tax=Mycena maculata TaxID=230809 RepID=A0AAD7MQ26_9AGAR|nr:hypothetical protein DFH07DRAFT_970077 [Mycena maculata]
MLSRGNPEDPAKPAFVYSGGADKFFPDIHKFSSWDLVREFEMWCCTRDKDKSDGNNLATVRKRISELIDEGLQKISGKKTITMSWFNYKVDIVHTLGVELAGWPLTVAMARPSKLPAEAARRILDKIRGGSIHWVALTKSQREEVAAEVENLPVKKRKEHSDKNKLRGKRAQKNKDTHSDDSDEESSDEETHPRTRQKRRRPALHQQPPPFPPPPIPSLPSEFITAPTASATTAHLPIAFVAAPTAPTPAHSPSTVSTASHLPSEFTSAPTESTTTTRLPITSVAAPTSPTAAHSPSVFTSAADRPAQASLIGAAPMDTGLQAEYGDFDFMFQGMDFGWPVDLAGSQGIEDFTNDGQVWRLNSSNHEDGWSGASSADMYSTNALGFTGGTRLTNSAGAGSVDTGFIFGPSVQTNGGIPARAVGAINTRVPTDVVLGSYTTVVPQGTYLSAAPTGPSMTVFSAEQSTHKPRTSKKKKDSNTGADYEVDEGADTDARPRHKKQKKSAPEAS